MRHVICNMLLKRRLSKLVPLYDRRRLANWLNKLLYFTELFVALK